MFKVDDLRSRAVDSRELLRAFSLLRRGRGVPEIKARSEFSYRADVEGTEGTYTVAIDAKLSASCDCQAFGKSGRRKFCKHVAAVALIWLGDAGVTVTIEDLDPELSALIAAMPHNECRRVLLEAAGVNKAVYARLLNGEWPIE